MEVKPVYCRIRFFSWFRARLTSQLYVLMKNHMKKHQKEYRQLLAKIGPEAFERPLHTHRNGKTTGWKWVGKVSRDNTKTRESILENDLAKNVSFSLNRSFAWTGSPRWRSYQTIQEDYKSRRYGWGPVNN